MDNDYSRVALPLVRPHYHPIAAEKKNRYLDLTERHIQALWWDQSFIKKTLSTSNGLPVTILSSGLWNGNAGPDFCKAHLLIDGREVKGDIEIHLTEDSWYSHGHYRDPAYDKTILHVVLWPSAHPKPIVTSSGAQLYSLYLADQLTISLGQINQLIDLDLYPYKSYVGTGKCASALFQHLQEDETRHFFQQAALWRLHLKSQRILKLAHNLEGSFQAAFAQSLGFPRNSSIFLQLYYWLQPQSQKTSPDTLMALCMGACQFFDAHFEKLWGHSTYYQSLKSLWNTNKPSDPPSWKLNTQRVRPQHHPVRRFSVLIKWLKDPTAQHLISHGIKLWKTRWSLCINQKEFKKIWKDLRACLPNYEDSYWNWHYLFESNKQSSTISLLGDGFKDEMLINIFLPLLYHYKESKPEETALLNLYLSAVQTQHGSSKYLRHRLFGDSSAGKIFDSAIIEQGALQLHNDFCQFFEASCIGCPFVERYNSKRFADN